MLIIVLAQYPTKHTTAAALAVKVFDVRFKSNEESFHTSKIWKPTMAECALTVRCPNSGHCFLQYHKLIQSASSTAEP